MITAMGSCGPGRSRCWPRWTGTPGTVVEWAGHSVEVLLEVYAKCLDGQDEISRRRVQETLGHSSPKS